MQHFTLKLKGLINSRSAELNLKNEALKKEANQEKINSTVKQHHQANIDKYSKEIDKIKEIIDILSSIN